jgi:CheY-like chemotaxis protein
VKRSRTIKAVAVVKDLFFVARIRETARLVGASVGFVRAPEELQRALDEPPGLVLIDLTMTGWDYGALFTSLDARGRTIPVLGFTTHALARQTQPLHGRCDRVVTRETLTQELGRILTDGIGRGEGVGARPPESGRSAGGMT